MSKSSIVSIVLAVVAIILGIFSLSDIKERVVFALDSITFEQNKREFTIGNKADIVFNNLPEKFGMSVSYHNNSGLFSWKIAPKSKEKLMYYKINDRNPNKMSLKSNSNVVIGRDTLDGESIISCLKNFKDDQHYFLLRNIFTRNNPQFFPNVKDDENIRSLVYRDDDGNCSIVILDQFTSIDGKGYVYEGIDSVNVKECKIQFYTVRSFSTKPDKVNTEYFYIDDINYYVKPEVMLTEWQAGHVMLRADANGCITMNMPKNIMFTCSVDSLRNMSNKTAGVLTLKQRDISFPIGGNIYLPTVSNSINNDFFNLRVSDEAIYVMKPNSDSVLVDSKFGWISPVIKKLSIKPLVNNSYVLNGRIGIIDWRFIVSYLFLPFVIWLAILIFFCFARKWFDSDRPFDFIWPIFIIAFGYCMCKAMIALKLSYTFPYFEKMTGIIVVYLSLFLLTIFLLTVLFNKGIYHTLKSRNAVWIFASVIWLGCFLVLNLGADNMINAGVIDSYNSGNRSFLRSINPLNWMASDSWINDTHRSIIYTLFAVDSIMILILASINIALKNRWTGWFNQNFKTFYINKISGLGFGHPWGRVVIMLVLLGILAVASMNVITFLITATLVWGLPKYIASFFSPYMKKKNNWFQLIGWVLLFFILLGGAFFLATKPDSGYITNGVGWAIVVVLFWYLVRSYNDVYTYEQEEIVKKMVIIFWIGAVVFGGIIVLAIFHLSEVDNSPNFERMNRRFSMAYNFKEYERAGYRYSESDREFVSIMNYYIDNTDHSGEDPLCNELHILHPSVSTGQSPVVLNDISMPCAFIGAYGTKAKWIFFILLAALFCCVVCGTLNERTHDSFYDCEFDSSMQRRLFAVFLWIGTSIYLYGSYRGIGIPFTGRLNPGLGVDSVGEALESAILLAMMALGDKPNNIEEN